MEDTILLGVEEVLTNLVTRYKTLSTDNSLSHNTLKEFDTELNDFINTYAKIKNLKASITAQELEIQLSEYKILIQDFQNRLNDGSIVGQNGTNGADGLSAYQVAVDNGFAGSQSQWLESLKGLNGLDGAKGADGQNGIDGKDFTYADFTPEQLALLKGEKGQDGTNGIDGTHGLDGDDGLSAYQIALNNGFNGSEIEWLESLKGADGQNGTNGTNGKDFTFDMFTPEQLALLKGADDQNGTNGSSFTFDMFTPEQLQLIANLVTVDLSSINNSITALQNQINALGGSTAPTVNTGNVVLNDLITSFVPTLANSKYYYDTAISVPEQLEYFSQYYKTDFSLTDIANTYKITYLVTYNDKVYTFVHGVVYSEMNMMWDMTLKYNLSSDLSADSLNFNVEILNDNKFIFSCGFDSEAPVYISSFDFAVFIESDSAVPDLNITSIKNADDLDFYDWVSL